jgi:Tfp pilus assembly protein PilF
MRKPITIVFAIISLLVISLTGCKPQEVQQLAFGTKEVLLMDGYYSVDPKIAEKSLLELSAHLLRAQEQKVENIDYDWTLGLTHGRLALLYQHYGRVSEAEEQFRRAFAHLDKSVAKEKLPLPQTEQKKRESLTELITTLDKNKEVKWKM